MENSPITNKQKILLTFSVLFLFIQLVILFIITSQKSAPNAASLRGKIARPLPTSLPTTTFFDTTGWILHKDILYTFSYPPDWTPQTLAVLGGGTIYTIRPKSAPANDYFPRIDIEIVPINPKSSLQITLKSLAWLNLQQKNILFHNVPAVELSGTLPIKFDVGNPRQKPIHKTYIFVSKDAYTYTIRASYYKDANSQKYQQIIQEALRTFTFR